MGRQPCCDKVGLKRGPWTIEEDHKLMNFILNNGIHCWRMVPKLAGLLRCGKSCRLRWINYLRPDLKRGGFTEMEENQIIQLHSRLGNRWSKIASHFPGRTDNEIKNHWNTRIKKRLKLLGVDPLTHKPIQEAPERSTGECQESDNNPETTKIEQEISSSRPPQDQDQTKIDDNCMLKQEEEEEEEETDQDSNEIMRLDDETADDLLNNYEILFGGLDLDNSWRINLETDTINHSTTFSSALSMEESTNNNDKNLSNNNKYGSIQDDEELVISNREYWVDSTVESFIPWNGHLEDDFFFPDSNYNQYCNVTQIL